MRMDATTIINRLGGQTALARKLGLRQPSIHEWTKRGIPRGWRKYLELAHPEAFRDPPAAPAEKEAA